MIKGIFVGYATNNTYRVYIPETGRIKTDCDVKFDESRNGYELISDETNLDQKIDDKLIIMDLELENKNDTIDDQEEVEEFDENGRTETDNSEYEEANEENSTQEDDPEDAEENEDNCEIHEQPTELKNRGRPRETTKDVMEVRRYLRREEEERELGQRNIRRSERIRDKQSAMLILDEEIPKNIREAQKSDCWKYWKQAVEDELTSIKKHKVWDVVSRPKDKRIIKSKWIFNIKEDPTTGQRKYKARLVALGCGQRPGVDYEETFAPVVRAETIRLLFSITAEKKRKMKIYDVKTAFLHGTLNEEIYMELPEGFQENKEEVCKLNRNIYGLKQAGRCWNELLTEVLIKIGLKQSKEDPCLFFVIKENQFLLCGIHIDDMVVVSSDERFERSYMKKIEQHIGIKNIGEAKTVLGMQLDQEDGKIFVHQKNYIEKLIEMYGMKDCNTVKSPIDMNIKMEDYNKSGHADVQKYQELIGRLMYLSVCTRPDLSFALSCLSQFNNEPRQLHMSALKRILRYLKGTAHYRLEFGRNTVRSIECEADASWDRTEDAKSFTGLLIYRNGDLIHWRSRKQSSVALSSTESEMEAMLEGLKEVIWTSRLLNEIDMSGKFSRELRCDNLNAVRLANGGNFKTKSKVLNRKCHFIREAVKEERINVKHVPNEEMTADCLTKPLSGPALLNNAKKFMNIKN